VKLLFNPSAVLVKCRVSDRSMAGHRCTSPPRPDTWMSSSYWSSPEHVLNTRRLITRCRSVWRRAQVTRMYSATYYDKIATPNFCLMTPRSAAVV